MTQSNFIFEALDVKACCAAVYESSAVRFLLGDSWRPGGLSLTAEILRAAGIVAGQRLLDVACGAGDSAEVVSGRFEADYLGIDLSQSNLPRAKLLSGRRSPCHTFIAGDAERLPFADESFDVILIQCAFCTFPDSLTAARELARVLREGGRLALADVTLAPGTLTEDIATPLARAACLAGAIPLEGYGDILRQVGLSIECLCDRPEAACDFLRSIDQKLLLARIAAAVGKLDLGSLDIRSARSVLRQAIELVDSGKLGYGYVIASKGRALR